MAHTAREKEKLIRRVRRIRGQVEALERAVQDESRCAEILQLVAACRGALNSLMSELIEGHILFHVLPPRQNKDSPQAEAAEEVIDVVRTYLR
ncbi:MAG TPA: metal/formaldehyde-sensitive transcriptional repressor [Candidatus Binatia bacterium]|nr:metal/formaldehyde-sensitive transcriptional repressor [Candidatus Binatia bacterium]